MTKGRILILVAVIVSGFLPVSTRALEDLGWGAIQTAGVRCLIGAIIIGAFNLKKLSQASRDWRSVALIGLATTMATSGVTYAFQHIPGGLTTALMFIGPIWVVLWESLHGRTTRWQRIACGVGFLGAIFLVGSGFTGDLDWTGVAAAIGASFGFALFFINSAKASKVMSDECLAFWAWAFAGVAFAYSLPSANWSVEAAPWIAFMGLVNGALYILVLFAAIRHIGNATETSIWQYTELITVGATCYFVFGEVPTPTAFIGMILILTAGLMLIKPEQTPATT